MDETELIAAARSGDVDAFAALYRQHVGYVRAIGRSILHKNDLDDMCQETFLLAFTRLDSFEGNSQFRTWLTRIAINQCLCSLRRGKRVGNGESYLLQLNAETAADALDRCILTSIDSQLENVPARLDLDKLLRVLKPIQRRILKMAYLEDMPDLEIAEALGMSLAAVQSTIYHAKRRVRDVHKKR